MFIADVQHPPRRETFDTEADALAWKADQKARYGREVVVWELEDRGDAA